MNLAALVARVPLPFPFRRKAKLALGGGFNLPAFVLRLWRHGFAAGDFKRIRRGVVMMSPLRPPDTVAGIKIPAGAREIPGTMTIIQRVEARGPMPLLWFLRGIVRVKVGDVVVVRLSHLDPLHVNTDMMAIEAQQIYAVLEPADG